MIEPRGNPMVVQRGLDHFIQLLDTSSVIIGLEFVFLNLSSIIIENLLFFVVPEES